MLGECYSAHHLQPQLDFFAVRKIVLKSAFSRAGPQVEDEMRLESY